MSKSKKVAILGTVPHKLKAPFNDKDFEIWAIAHACLGDPIPRCDRIFEIHKWDEVVKWGSPGAWKMHPNAPVYLIEKRDDVPNSLAFPFETIEKEFQIFPDRTECLMTNSISWMIALAIHEGYTDIHIYGVNMSHHSEYGFQKPSCEYYLGLAKGMGINIFVPTESDLCKSFYLYGKEEDKQTDMNKKFEDRLQFLQGMFNQYNTQWEMSRDARNQTMGALGEIQRLDQNKDLLNEEKLKDRIMELQKLFHQHNQTFEQSRDAKNQHVGAIEDVKYIMGMMKQ